MELSGQVDGLVGAGRELLAEEGEGLDGREGGGQGEARGGAPPEGLAPAAARADEPVAGDEAEERQREQEGVQVAAGAAPVGEGGEGADAGGRDFFIKGMNWDYIPIGTNYAFDLWSQPDDVIWPLGLVAQGIPTVRITAPASAIGTGRRGPAGRTGSSKARMVKNATTRPDSQAQLTSREPRPDMACSSARLGRHQSRNWAVRPTGGPPAWAGRPTG